MNQPAELRKVSLRRVEAVVEECIKNDKQLPDEIKLLGGLQRIEYVLVYPEQRDIVLAGPGEGWKVDNRGNIVGATTGRPVMLLDDLVVALRTARQAAQGGITCSIDPTAEGRERLRAYAATLRTMGDPQTIKANIEESLGPEQITFTNVPTTSHFAHVLLAADYHMKRLAMEFDPSPIRGLPGFLHMIGAGPKGMSNMMPRWWLEPKYQGVFRDPTGLAWELRGGSVKCMTEEDFLTAANVREHTGKASPMAQKWADNMTAKYDELALAEPIFGELRNCMELAVVGALLVKEDLPGKAGYSMPMLMSFSDLTTAEYPSPKQVESKASVIRKGHNWVIQRVGRGGNPVVVDCVGFAAERRPGRRPQQGRPGRRRQLVLELSGLGLSPSETPPDAGKAFAARQEAIQKRPSSSRASSVMRSGVHGGSSVSFTSTRPTPFNPASVSFTSRSSSGP